MTNTRTYDRNGKGSDAWRFRVLTALALAGSVLVAGCGNVTSGGFGDVEVILSSDEIEDLQETASELIRSEALPTSHAGTIEGSLTVSVRSFALITRDEVVELTDGVQEITLPLDDPTPVELARRDLPAGAYRGLRTFFGRIEANIVRGLDVNGEEIIGTVRVDLGQDGALTVTSLQTFEVIEEAATTVAIEMQSGIWLRLVDAVVRRVDLEDFRRIFRVRVRQRVSSGG